MNVGPRTKDQTIALSKRKESHVSRTDKLLTINIILTLIGQPYSSARMLI